MAYQTYTTDALVCGSFPSNTADKSYLLFTKSAGMLYASARSVREERSRQRYALQDFSHLTVSLVRGKTGWRIGSVDSDTNFFLMAHTREERGSVVRLIKHLRRYIQGEEPHPELYDDVLLGIAALVATKTPEKMAFEQFLMIRIVYRLGYVALPPSFESLFKEPLESITPFEYLRAAKECAPLLITAQSASHL